uniref:Delta(3,5)-Delta(2,4)-dienoyl-CoA isomerase, mitochondrial n=1 Tax=Parastrongyloides trichosuri TaxID=131310 RepID=A0A0N4ZKB9_PARTI
MFSQSLNKCLLLAKNSHRYASTLGKISVEAPKLKHFELHQPYKNVINVNWNSPNGGNAMSMDTFTELKTTMDYLSDLPECRSIVLTSSGKHFSVGLDLKNFPKIYFKYVVGKDCGARKAKFLGKMIGYIQGCISSLENCSKPVIVCTNGAVIGAAVHVCLSGDIRFSLEDTQFCIKEIDLGLAPDIGALERIQKVVGNDSLTRELCYTGRTFTGNEALNYGMVSRTFKNKKEMDEAGFKLANEIASKSPVAVEATKMQLNYARNHTVAESLDHIKLMNMSFLQSKDFFVDSTKIKDGSKPEFENIDCGKSLNEIIKI